MNRDQITELEKDAELNNGHCPKCNQTIKIYRYKLNRGHGQFLRAMALAIRDSGINDVDISTIGLAYSIRSQVTKMRQHGLIARVKDQDGKQKARRWLITKKGWGFLNNEPVASKVVVFNNQVLGHDPEMTTIKDIMGEMYSPQTYVEAPVSPPEAKVYSDVRKPSKYMIVKAKFKGRDYNGRFKTSQIYELQLKRLQTGRPIEVTSVNGEPKKIDYSDIASFQRQWLVV